MNLLKECVNHINAYLIPLPDTIVRTRRSPLSSIPIMSYGSKAVDGGGLILSEKERDDLLIEYPDSNKFIKKFTGADEFLNAKIRWCLWINKSDVHKALEVKPISERIKEIEKFRLNSKKEATRILAERSYQFGESRFKSSNCVLIPLNTSSNRDYIPIGFLSKDYVVSNLASVIYDAAPWILSILSSKMHVLWMKITGGRLGDGYRYSSAIVYNTFPFPKIKQNQKEMLIQNALNIISKREKHPEKTISQLYDPDKMPDGLREAHHQNDLAIERCYRSKPFESDEERLEYLFKLYEKMIAKEETK
jgi:hypothetical protein